MFHEELKKKIHTFVMNSYTIADSFPKWERFGLVSQLCRASMSVMLNYVEGYARKREKVKLTFYETSHGSIQECKYIFYFAYCRSWISQEKYNEVLALSEEIGKMLWTTICGIETKIKLD